MAAMIRKLVSCEYLSGTGHLLLAALQDFQPAAGAVALRTFLMVYNFAFFAMAVALFFGGPTFWPDKRPRLFGGYIAFLVSLAGAALVSAGALSAPAAAQPISMAIFEPDGTIRPGHTVRAPVPLKHLLRWLGVSPSLVHQISLCSARCGTHAQSSGVTRVAHHMGLLFLVYVQIEGVVNQTRAAGKQYAFIAWVAGSFAAGAADAVVGSVLNGEAAACKCNYVSWTAQHTSTQLLSRTTARAPGCALD